MKHLLLSITTILLLSVTETPANFLAAISGNGQTAQAGETFDEPIKIRVQKSRTDETPVPNIQVNFILHKGDWINYNTNPVISTLTLTTDENGEAGVTLTAEQLDEGVNSANYAVRITIVGDSRSLHFVLTVIRPNAQEPPMLPVTETPANFLAAISGNGQTAQAGETFDEPIKIRVQKSRTDETPVPNIQVNFILHKGDWINYNTNPVISTLTLTTDENGEADVTLTAEQLDEGVNSANYAVRVTIVGDARSLHFVLTVIRPNAQEPPMLPVTETPANFLAAISGNGQTAQAGETFDEPIKIRVQKSRTDETPVPNIQVNFILHKGDWINYNTNPVISTLTLTTDENGEAGVTLTAGQLDEGVNSANYAVRVTIVGDSRSLHFVLTVIAPEIEEPPDNTGETPSDPDPPPVVNKPDPPVEDPDPPPTEDPKSDPPVVNNLDPPTEDPKSDPPVVNNPDPPTEEPKPDPPVVNKPDPPTEEPKSDPPVVNKSDPPTEDPKSDPPVVNKPDPPMEDLKSDPPVVNNPDPPRNPTPVDDPNPDLPVVKTSQPLDPNEIWHVMYRDDNGQATVFVYPRCVSNPHHNPPKPACENNYGITEKLLLQVSPNFAIELQGTLEYVNDMLDLKLTEDNARLVQVGGVQGVIN